MALACLGLGCVPVRSKGGIRPWRLLQPCGGSPCCSCCCCSCCCSWRYVFNSTSVALPPGRSTSWSTSWSLYSSTSWSLYLLQLYLLVALQLYLLQLYLLVALVALPPAALPPGRSGRSTSCSSTSWSLYLLQLYLLVALSPGRSISWSLWSLYLLVAGSLQSGGATALRPETDVAEVLLLLLLLLTSSQARRL
ncbi:hypothetical protein CRUP_010530 [Coryphaenoides rupestris]|nr:hypothetical protein CRUP_010530 [Coryphaenoides rupestris]